MMASVIGHDRRVTRLEENCPTSRRSFLAMMAALIGPAASAQDDAEDRVTSAARLEAMRRVAKGIKVSEITDGKPGPPLSLRPEPLFRFTSPGWNVVDGVLWGWGEPGRPGALMKVVLRGPTRAQLHWHSGITVLSPKRVAVEFRDGITWSSRPPGLIPASVPDAPAPADSAAHRLLQAKDIARRLSASAETPAPRGRVQLRLLPRPIDRYSDATAGLLDGMLFEFVSLASPAVLVVLEARSEATGVRTWRYAFARQGAGESIVLLDGKRVWGAPSVVPPANTELYMGRSLPDSAAE
jgi:hypothetical protein